MRLRAPEGGTTPVAQMRRPAAAVRGLEAAVGPGDRMVEVPHRRIEAALSRRPVAELVLKPVALDDVEQLAFFGLGHSASR